MEEIRGITWDLWGEKLTKEQVIQRLVQAGFPIWTDTPDSPLFKMFAIVIGESGGWLRAWHINVERNEDGSIKRYPATVPGGPARMRAKSIDLGVMQFNTPAGVFLDMTGDAVGAFVQQMFEENPDLARGDLSAKKAYALWKQRGYQPWYAYKPGTPGFYVKLKMAVPGFTDWVIHSFVGPDPLTGKLPRMRWVEEDA